MSALVLTTYYLGVWYCGVVLCSRRDRRRRSSRDRDSRSDRRRGGDRDRRDDRDRDSSNGNRSVYCRNVHGRARHDDLRKIFEKYGEVKDVYIPKDFHTGEPREFAYVQYVPYVICHTPSQPSSHH